MEKVLSALACVSVHIPSLFVRREPFKTYLDKRKSIILTLSHIIILTISFIIYYTIDHNSNAIMMHKLMFMFVGAFLTIANIAVLPKFWREQLFTAGISSVYISVTYFTATYVIAWFIKGGEITDHASAFSAFVAFVVSMILLPAYLITVRRLVIPFLSLVTSDYWKRIYLIPITLFFVSFCSAPLNTYSHSTFLQISRLFLAFANIFICRAIAEDHGYMAHRIELADQLNIQNEYYSNLLENVQDARKARHDFKHHLAAIKRYLDNDDKSGMTEYFEEMNDMYIRESDIPYTGNNALDAIVYRYMTVSAENGINFELSGSVGKLKIRDTSLCVILGNALDNAVAGCLTLESNRKVKVVMAGSAEEQTIMLTNTFDGCIKTNDKGELLSRKRDNSTGIGLSSMKALCEQNNIIFDVRYDSDTFAVLFIFKND